MNFYRNATLKVKTLIYGDICQFVFKGFCSHHHMWERTNHYYHSLMWTSLIPSPISDRLKSIFFFKTAVKQSNYKSTNYYFSIVTLVLWYKWLCSLYNKQVLTFPWDRHVTPVLSLHFENIVEKKKKNIERMQPMKFHPNWPSGYKAEVVWSQK